MSIEIEVRVANATGRMVESNNRKMLKLGVIGRPMLPQSSPHPNPGTVYHLGECQLTPYVLSIINSLEGKRVILERGYRRWRPKEDTTIRPALMFLAGFLLATIPMIFVAASCQ